MIPFLLTSISISFGLLTLYLDSIRQNHEVTVYLAKFISIEGAKTALSILASAIISITTVTFSITVLILSISSKQLGVRLLPVFLRQPATQLVLGLFIGSFVYQLMILVIIQNVSKTSFTPYYGIVIGIALGLLSVFTLIYFIHFVSKIIKLDTVLGLLTDDVNKCMLQQSHIEADNKALSTDEIKAHCTEQANIQLGTTGFVQTVNFNALNQLAKHHDFYIKIWLVPGDYNNTATICSTVYSKEPINSMLELQIKYAFQLGTQRTAAQDLRFAFEQFSEIALNALSPGVCDPYTAIHCIEHIFEALLQLSKQDCITKIKLAHQNQRIILDKPNSIDEVMRAALSRLRIEAAKDYIVIKSLLEHIIVFLHFSENAEMNLMMRDQARALMEDAAKQSFSNYDYQYLKNIFDKIS